jgi:hypothetical protein
MDLSFPVFLLYLKELAEIKSDENLMRLAISTNPHAKEEDQKRLWRQLEKKPAPQKRKPFSKKRAREAKRIRDELKEKDNAV